MNLKRNQMIYEITKTTSIDEILAFWALGKKYKYQLYQEGCIQVNGKIVKQSCTLIHGDTLVIETALVSTRIDTNCPIKVVYEDDILLIVYKPKGYLVHSDGTKNTNIQDILCRYYNQSINLQAIHRIDTETSGLLLFSKSEFFQPKLDSMIANNEIQRTYLAIVDGVIHQPLTINSNIGRDRHNSKKMRISISGKPAITHVIPQFNDCHYSVIECNLETGRTHQIRVHLSSINHPIVGDTLYNKKKSKHPLCLHSYKVSFMHPINGKNINIQVEPNASDWIPQLGVKSKK